MSKKAAKARSARQGWNTRRSALALAGLTAIGAGIYYGAKHRTALRQSSPIAATQLKPLRPTSEALQLLSELRARFAPSPSAVPASDSTVAEQPSPLLPGLVQDFEKNPAGYVPHFAASLGKPEARVVLPAQASAPFQIEDAATGMHVEAKLEDVRDTPAELVEGYAVYRNAHASGATVLRRAMPNGSEDFLSFTDPPSDPTISYRVTLGQGVTGLRLVANTLELLDKGGTPRLRVAPPYNSGCRRSLGRSKAHGGRLRPRYEPEFPLAT